MDKREFKPGDHVKFKAWDEICKDYAEGKLDANECGILKPYCDSNMEFTVIHYDDECDGYALLEINDLVFDEDLLRLVPESNKMKITMREEDIIKNLKNRWNENMRKFFDYRKIGNEMEEHAHACMACEVCEILADITNNTIDDMAAELHAEFGYEE